MENITVYADLVTVLSTDNHLERREVEFKGERVGDPYRELGRDPAHPNQYFTETRGEIQTLYRTDKDILLVHVQTWSYWNEDPLTETLYRLTDDTHLQPGGRFEGLGRACGLARPLTWNEATKNG